MTRQTLRVVRRNQQMLTSLIYNRLSTDDSLAQTILAGYARYTAARVLDRPTVLADLAAELDTLTPSLKSTILT